MTSRKLLKHFGLAYAAMRMAQKKKEAAIAASTCQNLGQSDLTR
jgi:hypothetical protein